MSSNGIYVWDTKHGIPQNHSEANEILDKLSGYKESAPNPNMAAFGAKMAEFVRQAWQFYEGDDGLRMCLDIAEYTATTRDADYCFEFPPRQYQDSFSCAIIRAACENNLAVLHGDFECVFLPDGTAFNADNQTFNWHDLVEKHEQIWQAHIQELIAKQNQPQIPTSEAKRERLISKIVKERLGEEFKELLEKYGVSSKQNLDCFIVRTELFSQFYVFILTEKEKSDKELYFRATISFDIREKYVNQLATFIPRVTSTNGGLIQLVNFYGLANANLINPNIKIREYENGSKTLSWKVREYDEWVKLIEAAVDMVMYYLPHIGTVEDFVKFIQAHDAGETNFAQLTLPETDPALREFVKNRYMTS